MMTDKYIHAWHYVMLCHVMYVCMYENVSQLIANPVHGALCIVPMKVQQQKGFKSPNKGFFTFWNSFWILLWRKEMMKHFLVLHRVGTLTTVKCEFLFLSLQTLTHLPVRLYLLLHTAKPTQNSSLSSHHNLKTPLEFNSFPHSLLFLYYYTKILKNILHYYNGYGCVTTMTFYIIHCLVGPIEELIPLI